MRCCPKRKRFTFFDLGSKIFQHSTVFIHKTDNIALLIFGDLMSYRPHMLFNNITFQIAYFHYFRSIFRCHHSMKKAVGYLTSGACIVIFFAVIVKKVMKQTGTGSRMCIQMKFTANDITVILYIKTMLEACCRYMMSNIFKLKKLFTFNDITDMTKINNISQFLP